MCNFSGKLIAWLDHELPEVEAVNVEWHVQQCAECRQSVSAYQEISVAFLGCYMGCYMSCYTGTMPARPARNRWGWVTAACGIAAAILLAIALSRRPVERLAVQLPPPPPAPMMAYERQVSEKPARRVPRRSIPRPQWTPVEPMVEIAFPADAFFPPGAVPAGFSFIASIRFQE